MEDGPEGGGEEEGAGEGETGGAPTTPDGAAEDEFFDEGGTDGDAKVEEDGVLGGLAHGDHGFIGAIDSEMGSDEAEDEGAGDGGGSPDRPVPPFGFGVAEVVPAGPAGAGFADEPAGGTDEEDGDDMQDLADSDTMVRSLDASDVTAGKYKLSQLGEISDDELVSQYT